MDNNIQIFNNEELGTIRIMGTPDAPLFCLGDVHFRLFLFPSFS